MRFLAVRWRAISILALFTCTLVTIYRFSNSLTTFSGFHNSVLGRDLHGLEAPVFNLPLEYLAESEQDKLCSNSFGLNYLYSYARGAAAYTTVSSPGQMICFARPNKQGAYADPFCTIGPAVFEYVEDGNFTRPKFRTHCELIPVPKIGNKTLPQLWEFPIYMYETGPKFIEQYYMDLQMEDKSISVGSKEPIAILVKREGEGNLWHCLQEIFSLYATLDILRMTIDTATGQPLVSEADIANAHVVILDDLVDGPYFGLWDAIAQGPVLRLRDIEPGTRFKNLVLPIAGGASPFWEGNWNVLPCDHSELLTTFSDRIMVHSLGLYHASRRIRNQTDPLTITYVDRTEKRRLINQDDNLRRLASKFPDIKVQRVNFVGMPFADQIRTVAASDILVGVHGAGLTHSMFLPPESTIVEIIPEGMPVAVFRNLAKLGGHQYLGCHARMVPKVNETADHQTTDIYLDEEHFLDLMNVAVKSMANSGWRNVDVVPVSAEIPIMATSADPAHQPSEGPSEGEPSKDEPSKEESSKKSSEESSTEPSAPVQQETESSQSTSPESSPENSPTTLKVQEVENLA